MDNTKLKAIAITFSVVLLAVVFWFIMDFIVGSYGLAPIFWMMLVLWFVGGLYLMYRTVVEQLQRDQTINDMLDRHKEDK